jgi:sarcosine oxidase
VQTKSVIVSAGAWTSALIPTWKAHLAPTRQLQGWMNVESTPDPSLYNPTNMPTWYMSTPASKLPLYGIPADPNSETTPHSIKLGIHLRPQVVTDPTSNPQTTTEDELAELYQASSTALRDTSLTFASAMPCLYTMTPDSHFMIGRASPRIVCAAGLSGHGFKMTPALGEFLVDSVLGENGGEHWKADFCSPSRFGITQWLGLWLR